MAGHGGFDPDSDMATELVAAARTGATYDCQKVEIPAEWLRRLIVGEFESDIHVKGIRISHASITGRLDLEAVHLGHGVRLEHCDFEEAPNLVGACLRELYLTGSELPGLNVEGFELKQNLWLDNATVTGQIDINNAKITGQFSANEVVLDGGEQKALWAQDAEISGGIFLDKATVTGQIDITSAKIAGQFAANEVVLDGGEQTALWAQGAEISGGIFLRKATVTGQIDITRATIAGPFAANEVVLDGGEQKALWAQGAEISGGIFLRKATVTGQIDITNAKIAGQFAAEEVVLDGGEQKALWAQQAEISGGIFLRKATVTGQIDINNAKIAGQFAAEEVVLDGGEQKALLAQDAEISGGIFLNKATVTGQIDINGGSTSYLTVEGATLKGNQALYASHASVGRLVWGPELVAGVVDVRDCTVGTWQLRPSSLCTDTDQWRVTGFSYQRIESGGATWEVESRIEWLDSARDDRSPGPYQQMAGVLRSEGHNASARKVLIAGNNRVQHGVSGRLRRVLFGWTIGYGYRPWRVLLFLAPLFVGLALFVALAPANSTEPAQAWMVTAATDDDITAADDCDGGGPCLQPVVYALDTILPVIDFGQADDWTVNRSPDWAWTLAALVWVSVAAGWLFGILLAAAAGGLVRQT